MTAYIPLINLASFIFFSWQLFLVFFFWLNKTDKFKRPTTHACISKKATVKQSQNEDMLSQDYLALVFLVLLCTGLDDLLLSIIPFSPCSASFSFNFIFIALANISVLGSGTIPLDVISQK